MGKQNCEQPHSKGPPIAPPHDTTDTTSIPMVNTHPPEVTGILPLPGNRVIPEGAGQVKILDPKGDGGQVFPVVLICH